MHASVCKTVIFFFILFNLMTMPVFSITVSVSSDDGRSEVSLTQSYDLDTSTDLKVQTVLGEGTIQQTQWVSGQGNNKISQFLNNGGHSASSAISSSDSFCLNSFSSATGMALGLNTDMRASGEARSLLSGSNGISFASQESWTLSGIMTSNQALIAQGNVVRADQNTGIMGALGYSLGRAKFKDNQAEVTGGLNGQGIVFSQMSAIASDKASASGDVKGISLNSKAYSTTKAISAQEEAYSYLSTGYSLHTTLDANANEHVRVQQNLAAEKGILAYASAKDGTGFSSLAEEGSKASGSILVSTGSSPGINKEITGDIQSISLEATPLAGAKLFALPLPGSTRPASIIDNDNIEHIFVRGGDGALWDNKGGNWYSLGGLFNLNPSAVKDSNGNIHIFVQGGDCALWDRQVTNVMGGDWSNLGGQITSSPSAVVEPAYPNWIAIAARGSDNSLWIRDLNVNTMTSGYWSNMGGYIKGDPFLVPSNDGSNYIYTLVRGGDDGLWVNKADTGPSPVSSKAWYGFGGTLASDMSGAIEPVTNGFLKVAVRGADNSLWMCDIDLVASPSGKIESAWSPLGGVITSNPYVTFDTSSNIHIFARGSDNQLWDNKGVWGSGVYEHNWHPLGGIITSDAKPLMNPNTNTIDIAVQGGDGALWVNSMNPNIVTNFQWNGLGGRIT